LQGVAYEILAINASTDLPNWYESFVKPTRISSALSSASRTISRAAEPKEAEAYSVAAE